MDGMPGTSYLSQMNKKKTQQLPTEIADRVSILYRAIDASDESTVRSMLTLYEELEPNSTLPGLSLPLLHLAVGLSDNCPEIVELLLNKDGDPNNVTAESKVSPMHLSVMFDYDDVLHLLMRNGGDPKVLTGEGKNCYDLAKENVEEEMKERCFLYFYRRSGDFRKSIKPSDSIVKVWKDKHSESLSLSSLSDGFITCESDFEAVSIGSGNESIVTECITIGDASQISIIKEEPKIPQPQWNKYLMTEDESDSSRDEGRLSTIEEESALSVTLQRRLGYEETVLEEDEGFLDKTLSNLRITECCSSSNSSSITEPSFANSTPPILPPPTRQDLENLQNKIQQQNNLVKSPIPVTASTFQVLNRFAQHDKDKLTEALTPKPGAHNFSSELKQSITNLHVIDEWGNLKVDLLQSLATPVKKSKSFYNYLLVDPKVTKKVNFSGNHLKSDVIKNAEKFETFLRSIFYIGKGCGKRPIQHLVDAKAKYGTGRKSAGGNNNCGEKIEKILDIWKSGLGVIVVSVFHYSSEKEANVNEAAMIDAMGLVELSNIKKGSYSGTLASSWSQKIKNQFGTFLLYKCFCAFAVSEHKSFYPQDI